MTSLPRQFGTITPVNLQFVVGVLARQRHGGSLVHLLPVLLEKLLVDLGSGRGKSGGGNELLHRRVSNIGQEKDDEEDDGDDEDNSWKSYQGGRTRAGFPTSFRASQRKGFSKL